MVVDDGSQAADDVAAVVAASSRARLVRAEGDGPAAARNRGRRRGRGVRPDRVHRRRLRAQCRLARRARQRRRRRSRSRRRPHPLRPRRQRGGPSGPDDHQPPARRVTRRGRDHRRASRRPATWPCGLLSTPPCASTRTSRWRRAKIATGVRGSSPPVRTIGYAPGALVEHRPGLTVRRFWSQQRRYGRGAQRYRAAGGPERRRPPIAFYGRLLARGVRQGPAVGALVAAAQVATAAGVVEEMLSERGPAAARRR